VSPEEFRDRVQAIITPRVSPTATETTRWRRLPADLSPLAPLVLPRWDAVRLSIFRQIQAGNIFAPKPGAQELHDDASDFDPFASAGDDPTAGQRRDIARKLENCISQSRLPYDPVRVGGGKSAPRVVPQPPLRLLEEQRGYEDLIECCRDFDKTDNPAALAPFIREHVFTRETRELMDDLLDFFSIPLIEREAFFAAHVGDRISAFHQHFLPMQLRRRKGAPRWMKFYGLPDDLRRRLENRQLHLIELERERAGTPPANRYLPGE
jgi:hypothetical protein